MTPPEIRPPRQRVCLVVVGMHRSGTSVLTRVLSLLGAALPQNLLPPRDDNPTGFWEPIELMRLHEHLLAEGASRWDDWRAFDPSVLGAERLAHYRTEIARLIDEEYGDAPLLVLKEPRICRLLPLYEDSFAGLGIEPRYILSHRNPLAVISSLASRDGMTEGFAGLLWLRHALDAEVATRGKSRTFLSYEDVLEDWREAVERVGTALDVRWPRSADKAAADIEAYVSSDLRHHHPAFADLEANRDVPSWIKEAYAALRALESAGDEGSAALAVLTRIRREFDAAAPIFGRASFPELATREGRLRSELGERDRQLAEVTAAKQALEEEHARVVGERDRQLAEVTTAKQALEEEHARVVGERDRQLAEVTAAKQALEAEHARVVGERDRQLAEANAEKAEMAKRVASLQENVVASDAAAAELRDRIDAIYRSRSWRLLAPIRGAVTALQRVRLYIGRPVAAHSRSGGGAAFTDRRMADSTTSDDTPQFDLGWPGPHPLPPGRYLLRIQVSTGEKDLYSPRLYVDGGTGYAESPYIDLRFRRAGTDEYAVPVVLPHGAVRLRFHPGTSSGEFAPGRMRIRRVGGLRS